jgi:MFS family permease
MHTGSNYGYFIVGASCVVQAAFLGGVFTFGVMFPELERDFGWSRAQISGASSLAFLLMGVLAVGMGRINDHFGPRLLLTVGGISFGLGYVLMGHITSLWQLYVFYGLMVGIGLSTHDVGTLSTVARWFPNERGVMSGIVKAGAGVGQLLVPLAASALVIGYGWRTACMIVGVGGLLLVVGAAQIMRRDPNPVANRANGPGQAEAAASSTIEAGVDVAVAVRTRQFWILCLAKFADLFCLLTVLVHIVPHCIDQGLEPNTAAKVLATIGGVSIVGRLALGKAYDSFGAKRLLAICFAILFGSLAILRFAETTELIFLFGALYGIAHGGFFTVVSPSVAEYFGTKNHGVIFGLIFCSGTLGGTIGPVVAGYLFDQTDSYNLPFTLLLGVSLFGLLLATQLRPMQAEPLTHA